MGSRGRLFHGPYKKEFREKWLRRLLEMQKVIQETGPEDFRTLELIRIPELQTIRRIWVLEKHEFEDSLPRIYTDVFGIPFDDPEWIASERYQKEEWDILKAVCCDNAPEQELAFEMMYSLIDVENRASGLTERKGIVDELEAVLRRNFYKDEADATQYYTEKMVRKREMGGSYNEKFLEFPPEEAEDEAP